MGLAEDPGKTETLKSLNGAVRRAVEIILTISADNLDYDDRMGEKLVLDDQYYAGQAHDQAPWLIRDAEHRVVGHYMLGTGVSWGGAMREADKEWLADLISQKLAASKHT